MPDAGSSSLVVPDSLEESGPYVQGVSNQLAGMLADLRRAVDRVQEFWTGGTHEEYLAYQTMWDTAAAGLFGNGDDQKNPTPGILPQIARALTIAYGNYIDVENLNRQGWRH